MGGVEYKLYVWGTYRITCVMCYVLELRSSLKQCSEYQRPFSHGCHLSPGESAPTPKIPANWLPVGLVHSPASISQRHAFSSIGKTRLLLARVPWKGSRRLPLNNIPRVAAAAPRVEEMPGQPRLLPSSSGGSSSSGSWSRTWRPSSSQDAS